jgi:hypothetical protein
MTFSNILPTPDDVLGVKTVKIRCQKDWLRNMFRSRDWRPEWWRGVAGRYNAGRHFCGMTIDPDHFEFINFRYSRDRCATKTALHLTATAWWRIGWVRIVTVLPTIIPTIIVIFHVM